MTRWNRASLLLVALSLVACTANESKTDAEDTTPADPVGETLDPTDPATSCAEDDGVVMATPSEYNNYAEWGFDRYAEVVAPNGKAIRIFIEDGVTDNQAQRARNVLRFFLTDHAGSRYGADKSAVANAMANNRATLMLPAGAHEEGEEPPFDAQPLFQAEMTVEGGDWYMNNSWEHRDATFEEIFHLVHDGGIGTWLPGALPAYQSELKTEALAAIDDGRWGIPVDPHVEDWLEELAEEDSLAQEYIASVIDSYYGYWGAFDEAPGGMWGVYIAKTRAEIAELDPVGGELLEAFLPPMAAYEARLEPELQGTFSMEFDADAPYTHKSQYLQHATLTGDQPSNLRGNDSDNRLRGNSGNNAIDGGDGTDTVVYCDEAAAYAVTTEDGVTVVSGPDGTDELRNIERIQFFDGTVELAE
jgi:hypothetical protein